MRKIITVISGITFFVIYLAGSAANFMYPKLQWSHDGLFGLWLGLSALLFTVWAFLKFGIMRVPGNQRWALYFLYPAMMVLGGLAILNFWFPDFVDIGKIHLWMLLTAVFLAGIEIPPSARKGRNPD